MATRRRHRGDGSIRERSPGVWQLRVNHSGRTLARTVHGTRKDASAELARLRVEADRLAAKPAEIVGLTVADLIEAWWKSPTVAAPGSPKAENSLRTSDSILRNWIIPHLGHVRLARLNARDIERMVGAMQAKGLKPITIRRYVATLSVMLNQAVLWDWIDASPLRKATLDPAKRYQIEAPDTRHVVAILNRLSRGWHGPHADTLPVLVYLLAVSGIRKGEACGLKWVDVNWRDGYITVARSVTQSSRSGVTIGPPKNKKPRIVTLEPADIDVLHRLHQLRSDTGDGAPDRYLFGPDGGREVLTPSALAGAYKKVRDSVDVPLTLHGFRHWHATHLLDLGIPIRTVQERLGHSNPSITLNTYAHPVDTTARLAAQRISQLVAELTAPEVLATAAQLPRPSLPPPDDDDVEVLPPSAAE